MSNSWQQLLKVPVWALLSLLQLTVWLFVADASPALQAEVKSMQSRMGVLELENKTIQTQLNQSLHTSQKERDIGEASSRRPSWLSLLRLSSPAISVELLSVYRCTTRLQLWT